MNKGWAALALGLGLLIPVLMTPWPATAEVLDRIVATVNGEIITLKSLTVREARLALVKDQAKLGLGQPGTPDFKRKVLELMIDELLTQQKARRLGVQVTEQEVQAFVGSVIKSGNMTQAEFEAKLAQDGQTLSEFREQVRLELIKRRTLMADLRADVVISDEEVDAFIKIHARPTNPGAPPAAALLPVHPAGDPGAEPLPGSVHVRNIVLDMPAGGTEEELQGVRGMVVKVYQELKDGLDFAQAAAKYSDAPTAGQGGDLGWIAWKDMHPQLRVALEYVPEGGYTGPIQAGNSVQIFQVVELDQAAREARAKRPAPKTPTASAAPAPVGAGGLQVSPQDKERVRSMLAGQKLEQKYVD
ncbi:MAG: SurA N-terminal domain-containing protein, partial [Thermodesulfobacteriota bacterium]